jgi:hypothetical protein
MRTNLKAILAAMGAAALLAAPAMAKTNHSHADDVVSGARGSAALHSVYGLYYGPSNEGGPYTPSAPTPAYGQSRDFQDAARGE